MQSKTMSKTRVLVECAVLVAIASVLSLIKLVDLPYGGSVTIASMLPIVIISYRHGLGWGLGSGFVFGAVQQLLGLKNLSYVTTWQSVVAVILLDYILAFTVIGAAGIFKKSSQNNALAFGSLFVCVLRYVFHVISGATVWAGLSIPTTAALAYSLAYNATYMIPETIVLAVSAYYIGSVLDFKRDQPVRIIREKSFGLPVLKWICGLLISGMLIFDTAAVFSKLQDGESGEFYIEGLSDVNWTAVIIVSAVCIVLVIAALIVSKVVNNKRKPA